VPKDQTQAAAWYKKAAEAGSAVGMFNLGTCYESGKGIDKDMEQAIAWYRKAADAGDAMAQKWLADHAGN
jgi:uncharacterized protein